MWHFTRVAIRSRFITIAIAALLAAASIWATMQLKLEMIPDVDIPFRIVITVYPDASPDEVADEVTIPIENAIWDEWEGRGLNHLYSTSTDGISIIIANFEYGTDMEEASRSIRQGIDGLELPQDIFSVPEMNPRINKNPNVIDVDLSMMPLVMLSLTGNVPTSQLRQIAEEDIVPKLIDIEGVFDEVEIEGGEREMVLVSPDPDKMKNTGISMYQIAALLSMVPQYASLGDFQNAPLLVDGITLGDIAEATLGSAPMTAISRTNGETSVGIIVMKEAEANTIDVANEVVTRAEEINQILGNDLELKKVFDQSDFIERSIWDLTQMALIGGALAIIIVFLFLWAFRASLVTAMSIPFSIIIGFLAMYLSGLTINLLTLSAMAIAVGRLIDNSIVVTEVIYRRLKRGEGYREASINGSKEVAGPITSSTLATVAIFIPLAFAGGIVGELFIPFSLTITYALIASLLVGLMVVPALSNWFVSSKQREETVEAEVESGFGESWYHRLYVPSLKWALSHRAITLIIAGVLFIGSLGLLPLIGSSFLPGMSEKMLYIEIKLPPGTDISTTKEMAVRVETLLENAADGSEIYYATIGTSTSSMHGAMTAAFGGGDNTADIIVILDQNADLEKERSDLELAVEESGLGEYVTVMTGETAMKTQMGFAGLELSIQGDNYEDIAAATALITGRLENIEGLSDLESQLTVVVPKLDIDLAQEKIAAIGLTDGQIQQLQEEKYLLEMGGELPHVSVRENGDSYSIFIKGIASDLYQTESPAELTQAIPIGFPLVLALGDVADVQFSEGLTHISHTDLRLSATISGAVTQKDVGAVNRAVEGEIDAVNEELEVRGVDNVDIKIGGIAEDMVESFSSMGIAILAAIVIAILVLVLTMRSIVNPIIIMISLPLASIGAFLGLLIAGYTLDMSGMMGVLMLVGIVLTNAIVLIALTEQLRKGGASTYDALVKAGRTRLRPILMTALTTMIAMVPLAVGVGEGTIIAAELAVVVIGGLFSSTLLTLLVIPVMYSLVDGLRQSRRRTI